MLLAIVLLLTVFLVASDLKELPKGPRSRRPLVERARRSS